jgi:AcrR family transcriptional regulator
MTSTEKGGTRRPYRLRERARRQEETRRRITEAAVELHRTVGAARTTVSEVASRAGVGRMTVYNHFPTEADLVRACTGHWAAEHPLPDIRAWAGIDDPDARTRAALAELYGWYAGAADMMGNALRDAPLVPALEEVMRARWWPAVDAMVDALAAGRRLRGRRAARVRGAIRVAVDLGTWRTLTAAGLGAAEAARLAADMIAAAAAPGGRRGA